MREGEQSNQFESLTRYEVAIWDSTSPIGPYTEHIISPETIRPLTGATSRVFTSDDLPVGLELLSRPFTEGMLLGLGYAYEQATGHRRPPATTPRLTPR